MARYRVTIYTVWASWCGLVQSYRMVGLDHRALSLYPHPQLPSSSPVAHRRSPHHAPTPPPPPTITTSSPRNALLHALHIARPFASWSPPCPLCPDPLPPLSPRPLPSLRSPTRPATSRAACPTCTHNRRCALSIHPRIPGVGVSSTHHHSTSSSAASLPPTTPCSTPRLTSHRTRTPNTLPHPTSPPSGN